MYMEKVVGTIATGSPTVPLLNRVTVVRTHSANEQLNILKYHIDRMKICESFKCFGSGERESRPNFFGAGA